MSRTDDGSLGGFIAFDVERTDFIEVEIRRSDGPQPGARYRFTTPAMGLLVFGRYIMPLIMGQPPIRLHIH
ncbi:hypothetical protein AB0E01_39625 [Nocardia vinacea]|uniref:hypothetical protein n=1 Tax=Nocardia vinacea TaxID=96468 RepID=UPI0033EFF040